MATKAYLQSEAENNEAENTIALPAIMGWFRSDFGGKKRMTELLHRFQIVPKEKTLLSVLKNITGACF